MSLDIKYLQILGKGQWGEVFLIKDNNTHKLMAFKKL